MSRLRKHRHNEQKEQKGPDPIGMSGNGGSSASGTAGGSSKGGSTGKNIPARTSIQQTQGSNNLIKKETANRRSYLNK